MSKEFYEIIETEIKRREEARIRQEKRKEKLEIERIKRIISNDFETYLRKQLDNWQDYDGKHIMNVKEPIDNIFIQSAEELGFKTSFMDHTMLQLSISEDSNTPASKQLHEFRKRLANLRNERKNQLLKECKRVKNLMRDGKFTYDIQNPKYALSSLVTITVKSVERVEKEFEIEIVKNYFDELKFKFVESNNTGEWIFKREFIGILIGGDKNTSTI